MKTTLDGVVFFVAARVRSCKNGVSPQADFPQTEGRGRKWHAPSGRILPNPDGGAAGRGGRTGRQNGAVRWTAGQSGRTGRRTRRQNRAARRIGRTRRQDGAARRSSRTERQDGAARRSGRTVRQDGAARRSGKTERQDGAAGRGSRKRGGGQSRVIAADRSGGAARTNKKTGETIGPARFSTGIPTAGSRRTAKKRTEKRPGIGKRPMHRFSIRCSDTGKGAILSARPPLVK